MCDKHPGEPWRWSRSTTTPGRDLPWGELQACQPGRRTSCAAHGVGRGDRVAVVLPPHPRDRRDLLRHLEARRDPAHDVGPLRRRRHRPPDDATPEPHRPGHRRRPTPPASRPRSTTRVLVARRRAARGATESPRRPDPSSEDLAQLYYTSAPPGWPRASCTPIATSWPTPSSRSAMSSNPASASTAWASGRGRRASRRCSAPALRRRAGRLPARGRLRPGQAARLPLQHPVTNVFATPTAIRSMMGIADAGEGYPQRFRPRLLGRRAAEPRGDPLVPRPVRASPCSTTTASLGVLPARAGTSPGWRSARARWGGRCRAGTCRSSTRTSGPRRRASAARSACARAPTRITRSATGATRRPREETFGGEWFHTKDAARRTRTATSGTRAAPTT